MNTKRRADCQLWHDWKERIIRIGDEQTSLQNQFDNLRNEFTDNSPRIAALEADVNALDGRLIIAESDIADAEDRISACENDIDRIDAELVDKTGEINNLANRMSLAEADIDNLDARVSGIETGEILLSQMNIDSDKDMGGYTLSNLNLENVTVNNIDIEPSTSRSYLIWDSQPYIEAGTHPDRWNFPLITARDDPLCPYGAYLKRPDDQNSYNESNWLPGLVPIEAGVTIHSEIWAKYYGDGANSLPFYWLELYDSNKNKISAQPVNVSFNREGTFEIDKWIRYTNSYTPPTSHEPYNGSDGGPVKYIRFRLFVSGSDAVRRSAWCGLKIWVEPREIYSKSVITDSVIIRDGGTVDGVDISTHTHDGTAIGGPKISYNDLVDKPDIPTSLSKPPMPYKKTVSINLAYPSGYIDVLDIIPEGRTALTVEQLQYRSIANIVEGTGPSVVIGLKYDDNTVATGVDQISKNGNTDWHPPTYYGLNQQYHFTKNYIKGIRIQRTPGEGANITGYVDIIGHVY